MPIPPREIYAVAGNVFVSNHITEAFFGKCWLCVAPQENALRHPNRSLPLFKPPRTSGR